MLAVVAIMVILLAWGLVAGRLARWSITAPIAMVLAGLLLTAGANPVFVIDLDTSAVEHTVEVVLAVLLFVDATEVRGGLFGGRPTLTARLLLIALPLSWRPRWSSARSRSPPRTSGCWPRWPPSSSPPTSRRPPR